MTSAALLSVLKPLMEMPRAMRHHGPLQVAAALLHSLDADTATAWEQLMGIEKVKLKLFLCLC
jgi:hypothetical protein